MNRTCFWILLVLTFLKTGLIGQNYQISKIDTSYLVNINNVEQYLEIKGNSKNNPVLLFIHGGPSWPMTPFLRIYNKNLLDHFVVVSWDQRNCGKSKIDSIKELTTELYVNDAHLITQELKRLLNVPKLHLVCHSWGTVIGIKLITQYPQDYHSYIGIGQFVNSKKAIDVGLKFIARNAEIKKDTSIIKKLKKLEFTMDKGFKNGLKDILTFSSLRSYYAYSGIDATLPYPPNAFKDYNVKKMSKDSYRTLLAMESILFDIDIEKYTDFKIPVYFLVGRHDYDTPWKLTKQYFKTIRAPNKELIWFAKSGHAPNWEEPDKFKSTLMRIIKDGKNR